MKVISGRQNLEIEFGEVRKFWVKRDFFPPVFGGRESVRPEEGMRGGGGVRFVRTKKREAAQVCRVSVQCWS